MDDARFDAFARSLTHSRRGAARLLGSLACGGVPAIVAVSSVEAKKRKKKRKKQPPPPPPPSGTCQPNCAERTCGSDGCGGSCGSCSGGQECRGGTCDCPRAAPHFCASAGVCVPACPTGMGYDPNDCGCDCAVPRSCCQCTGGANPFCSTSLNTADACITACNSSNPGGTPFVTSLASSGTTGVCGLGGRCELTCFPVTGVVDACQQEGGVCQGDLQRFQPLGGGPTRCGRPTDTASCGCTSHQQCADNHGIGAFCVSITGPRCTCAAANTFCATQA